MAELRSRNVRSNNGCRPSSTSSTLSNVEYTQKLKVMMLGDAGVGKTSIARRFVDNQFLNTYIHTVGIDFLEKIFQIKGKHVKLQIWDTAGQERFRSIIKPYYRGAAGIVLAYDVTDKKTFADVEEWINCIADNTQPCQIIQKVLLANKIDLPAELHQVTTQAGRNLAIKQGIDFFEVSAKDGRGISDAFYRLTDLIIHAQDTWQVAGKKGNDDGNIILAPIPVIKAEEKKCCRA